MQPFLDGIACLVPQALVARIHRTAHKVLLAKAYAMIHGRTWPPFTAGEFEQLVREPRLSAKLVKAYKERTGLSLMQAHVIMQHAHDQRSF